MAQCMKTFFDCVIKDFNQNELLSTKLLFFIHSLSTLILYPFLVVQMKHLGLDVQETAIISFVTPVVSIILPLLTGRIAEKIGHIKYLLAASSVVAGTTALLLLLVPVGRTTVMFPENLIFSVSCEGDSIPYFSLHGEDMCILHENKKTLDSFFHQQSCGFGCQAYLDQTYTDYVMNVSRYKVLLYDVIDSKPMIYTFPVEPENKSELRMETQRNVLLKNDHRYSNTIMKMSKNSFYFPTMHMFNFTCNMKYEPKIECIMGGNEQFVDFKRLKRFWNARLKLLPPDSYDMEEDTQTFEFDYLNSTKQKKFVCKRNELMNSKLVSVSINVDLPHSPIKHLDIGSCSLRCLVTTRRDNVCVNPAYQVEKNVSLTFWSYLGIRVVLDVINSASIIMFEAIVREQNDDYGLKRVYVMIGGMICSPFSGWMVDYASLGKNYHDFRPVFVFYALLKIVTGILIFIIDIEFKKEALSIIKEVKTILRDKELLVLFLTCATSGFVGGFIEIFLFWFMDDMESSIFLMGLTVTVSCIIGIPLATISGSIIKKMGHANTIFIIVIVFCCFSVRLLGYSLIYDPWWCLPFEVIEPITFMLMSAVSISYATKLSTVKTDYIIQGGLHYGLGKCLGIIIGGHLIKAIGIRQAFQTFATVALLSGIVYVAVHHSYLKQPVNLKAYGTDADSSSIFEGVTCNSVIDLTESEDEQEDLKD
ncbi:uncharacterized protein LOC114342205 [Diabrotica virgifera virgifera]|uniref:Uncharacterized protein LOC114342205 n=1 Tax=Diabrotica virgifera virgifera TaxID=50390 RepID=A0A6P7GRX0_DIAVI|nr:uncharacterized protein LOC114342205 [Diabrotica virgifera virgifera]